MYWQYPNLNKTPLSSPELCKANKVISSQRDSWESGGSSETEKAVAIFRPFLFKLQVKMSVLSPFQDENPAHLAFKDVMRLSSLKLQGIWNGLMLLLYQHFTIPAQWLYTSAESSVISSLLRQGQQSPRLSPFSGADVHFWWCFYSSPVNYKLKISIMWCLPCIWLLFSPHTGKLAPVLCLLLENTPE